MGFSISWLACRGPSFEVVATRLGFTPSGKQAAFLRAPLAGRTLPGGWHLLVAKRCDALLVKAGALASLSTDCTVVACSIEEHVMFSSAEAWQHGKRLWRIEHAAEEGDDHLAVEGTPPDILAQRIADARACQSEDSEVGWFFEIPLDCAKNLVGFKHDEVRPEMEDEGFIVLQSMRGEKVWWRFW
ncbi:MAG: hypothetical protein KA603_01160 [Azonexus sp.]|nr:hypothetical protein [Betaproteobacteria bacterium]MBP6034728.1 hypothetical protein [Azonexus sp.]MBP6905268.1 hypothetical protein [Azonexus sp.]